MCNKEDRISLSLRTLMTGYNLCQTRAWRGICIVTFFVQVFSWFPHFRTDKFPVFFCFPVFYLINLTNPKIYLPNTLQLKYQRKKNWIKFPHFSSILVEILFSSILGKIPWLEMFSHFSSLCGNGTSDNEYTNGYCWNASINNSLLCKAWVSYVVCFVIQYK